MTISRVCVVGAGQMGTGIAIVAARFGKCQVSLIDKFPASLDRSRIFVQSWAKKEEGKGTLPENFLSLINFQEFEKAKPEIEKSEFVIEAVPEIFDLN